MLLQPHLIRTNPGVDEADLALPADSGAFGEPLDEREVKRIALELLEVALDLTGLVDPTPLSDTASALLSLSQGRWFDAAISGLGVIPWLGDVAKTGKFPRYVGIIDRALSAVVRSRRVAAMLRPALERLERVVSWIPSGKNAFVRQLKQRLHAALRGARGVPEFPDVRRHFQFFEPEVRGRFTRRVARGRLGVPGRVKRHRLKGSQKAVNRSFPGDDAGHFFGDRFGAPGDARNLSAQNWLVNRRSYKRMEDAWAKKLKQGHGIEVTVVDVTRTGETRPFMRRVEWIETAPSGRRTRHARTFANPDSPKSRAARAETNPFGEEHLAEVFDLSTYRNRKNKPPGGGRPRGPGGPGGSSAEPRRIPSAHELTGGSGRDRGPNHDFPAQLERWIYEAEPQVISENYILYSRPGTLNGTPGRYEIGVQPSQTGRTQVVKHRFFRPDKPAKKKK